MGDSKEFLIKGCKLKKEVSKEISGAFKNAKTVSKADFDTSGAYLKYELKSIVDHNLVIDCDTGTVSLSYKVNINEIIKMGFNFS